MNSNNEMYDLVIIGAAAAGCAAAVYAARRGLNFVVVAKDIGGEVALSGEVENWPGTIHTDGFKLAQDFYKHALGYGVKFDIGFEITGIEQQTKHHIVRAKNENGEERSYAAKTVIIASGIHPRVLNVAGEEKLKGRGITSCTVCDGPLYKGKVTATIGAGNSALESALMMTNIAKKVYLITKYPNAPETNGGFPKGEFILIDKVKGLPNVEILYQAETVEILGENSVSGLVYRDLTTGENKGLELQGVMVHIGMTPNTGFVTCANKNKMGEVEVNMTGETNCPGIFAAGDATNIPFKQIAIAAGQGVTAALSAISYVNKWHE